MPPAVKNSHLLLKGGFINAGKESRRVQIAWFFLSPATFNFFPTCLSRGLKFLYVTRIFLVLGFSPQISKTTTVLSFFEHLFAVVLLDKNASWRVGNTSQQFSFSELFIGMKVMKFETTQIQFSSSAIFAAVAVVVAQGDVTGDDNFATTIYSTVATLFRRLQHCSNIATLCCAKNRRRKSSRVTSHLACSSTLSDSGEDAKVKK